MTAAALLRYDAAVPARDRLLDPDEMRICFARHLDTTDPVAAELVKVKYCFGHSLRVVYRVASGTNSWVLAMRTMSASARAERIAYASAKRHEESGVFEDSELGALLWTIEHDHRLPGAAALLHPAPRFRSQLGRDWQRSRLVGYAPEKSIVVACLGSSDKPVAFAKLYATHRELDDACRAHEAIATRASLHGDRVHVAPFLGCDDRHLVMFTAHASGRRLDTFEPRDLTQSLAMLGGALAHFHELTPPAGLPSFARTLPGSLSAAAEMIAAARPELGSLATSVVDRLLATARNSEASVLLHGDVHLKNVLQDGNTLTLIDLDQAAVGSPAADLGSFLAVIRNLAHTGSMTFDQANDLSAAFLSGYARVGTLPEVSELHWATAAALVGERAVRAIGRMRFATLARLDAVLGDAWTMSAEAGGR